MLNDDIFSVILQIDSWEVSIFTNFITALEVEKEELFLMDPQFKKK